MTDTVQPLYPHPRKNPLPSIDELRADFRYDPESGQITGPKGRTIGTAFVKGYVMVSLKTPTGHMNMTAHRLAFALMTGQWPNIVDHINRDRSDNRWSNLRDVTQRENAKNRSAPGTDGKSLISRHITRNTAPNALCFRQGFGWQVQLRFADKYHTHCYRDFCKAWKRRRALLEMREQVDPRTNLPGTTSTLKARPPTKIPSVRPLALWAWADKTADKETGR